MGYVGDMQLGQTLDTKFCTVQSTGAPTTLAGSPVVSAYVGNGTTELTAGITLTVDFDGRTGLNNVRVAATGGNGYAAQTDVQLVITTGTVNSVSAVGYIIGEFSIENRVAAAFVQVPRFMKYAVGTATQGKIRVQIPKARGLGWAGSGDWTPATGDVKVSIDAGAQANIGTLPAFANGALEFTLTAGELTGKRIKVTVSDVAPKAVNDLDIEVETFGHASALYPMDWSTVVPPANWAATVISAGGIVDANVQKVNDVDITGNGSSSPFGV